MRQFQVCSAGHRWDPLADGRPSEKERWELCPVCGGAVEMFSLHDSAHSGPATPVRAQSPLLPGYEVLDELGRGGMGIIYKARQIGPDRLVALKLISAGAQADASDLARFRAEAESVSRLRHPNIVRVYDVGEQAGLPFFALELMDRGSLARVLAGGPLPARDAAELVEMLARAIQVAHEAGIVHRDLKPANVLLATPGPDAPTSDVVRSLGVPKISDFGLAKKLDEEVVNTRTGNILGTPAYMAPEQAEGKREQIGPPADIHALGAIIYEALTGRPPFKGATALETLEQVRSQDPVSPSRIQPGLPRPLITICLKALAKEPHRRYASALDLADDLRAFLDNRPIRARPTSSLERAWRWGRRRPAVVGLGALTLMLTFVALALVAWTWSEASARTRRKAQEEKIAEEQRRKEEEDRRGKVVYYAALVRRNGAPVGVAPLDEQRVRRREVTYKFYQKAGKVQKVEAVNRHGQLTASPNPLGYMEGATARPVRLRPRPPCRWEYLYNERGEVSKEIAYDQAGMVVWAFHFTERNTGYFTDRRGFPRPRFGSGAAFVSLTYTENGLEREQRYLDRSGKPAAGPDGIFGRRLEHDERGLVIATSYLGARDQPVLHPLGFAQVMHKHDDLGNIIERAYLGLDGKPTLHRFKGWSRETAGFDADGNLVEQRYFGIDGRPHRGPGGIAGIRLSYDARGFRTSQVFLDVDGGETAAPTGVVRIVYRNDEHGNCIEETYLDGAGQPARSESGAHRIVRAYDERHQVRQTAYFGPDGRPAAVGKTGIHKETTQHDERGQVVERTVVGVDGKPVAGEAARTTYAYSARGYPKEVAHFDEKGKAMLGPDGAARVVWTWDEHGNNLEQACFGPAGDPVTPSRQFRVQWLVLPMPYARVVNTYDDRGNCTESVCYRPDTARRGQVVLAARYKNKWDEHGNLLEMATYDGNGELFAQQGLARVTLKYDEQGHATERVAYGADGAPLRMAGGATRHTREFDEAGHLVREAFFDSDENGVSLPRLGNNGYASANFTYDRDGKLADSKYFDAKGTQLRTQVVVTASGRDAFDGALREGDVILAYNGRPVVCARALIDIKRTEDYGRAKREAVVLRGGRKRTVAIPSGPIVRFAWPNRRQIMLSGLDSHLPVQTRAVAE
jgi:serine/threonine protein kinase